MIYTKIMKCPAGCVWYRIFGGLNILKDMAKKGWTRFRDVDYFKKTQKLSLIRLMKYKPDNLVRSYP